MLFIYILPFGVVGVAVAQVSLTFMISSHKCPGFFFILDGGGGGWESILWKKILAEFAKNTFDALGRKHSTKCISFFLQLSTCESWTLHLSWLTVLFHSPTLSCHPPPQSHRRTSPSLLCNASTPANSKLDS